VAAVAALPAAGCGGAAQESALTQAGRTTRVAWLATGNQARVGLHQQQIARFRQLTGHDVEFIHHTTGNYEEKLYALLASGTGPDIFRLEGPAIAPLATASQLLALDPLIKRDKLDVGDFFAKGLAMYEFQKQQFALPWLAYRVLFYNADLLQKNAVARPPLDWKDKRWNHQAFLAALKRFVSPAAPPAPGGTWAFGGPFTPQDAWVFSLGNGAEVLDEEDRRFTLDQPPGIEGLQFFADLINVHRAHPTVQQAAEDNTQNAFLAGRMAFYYGAVATAGRLKEVAFASDTAPFPWGSTTTATTGGGHGWPLNKASKEQEAAWQLQRFLASKENDLMQVESGEAPPFRKSTSTAVQWKERRPPQTPETMAEGATYLARRPKAPTWDAAERTLNTALQSVWTGQRAARDAVQSVRQEIQSILDQGWQQLGKS
jgi:multiple sugar transport system substrate-binding protein